MTFKKGQSGNPAGRAKGRPDIRRRWRELLEPHGPELMETALHFAKAGDMTAMKLLLDRLAPPVREEAIHVQVPPITCAKDCTAAQANVLNAVATGAMLPNEGAVLSGLIGALGKAYETTDVIDRLSAIELQLKEKGIRP